MNARPLLHGLFLSALCAVVGCGPAAPATGTVSGRATVKGQPLDVGVLRFFDAAHGTGATAPLAAGGRFEIDHPIRVGTYVVYWSLPSKLLMPGDPPPPKAPEHAPHRDANEETSKVQVEVQAGANTFDLDLQ